MYAEVAQEKLGVSAAIEAISLRVQVGAHQALNQIGHRLVADRVLGVHLRLQRLVVVFVILKNLLFYINYKKDLYNNILSLAFIIC